MAQLNNWQYCRASTQLHPLSKAYPKHLQKINEILSNEGAKSSSFKKEIALNLDGVEADKASKEKRARRKTVDLSFCITKESKSGQKTKPQVVLTELKLNLKSKNNVNIKEKDIQSKASHSIDLLTREVQIHDKYLLVVKNILNRQAENRLKRKLSNNPKYKVLSIKEFHNIYFNS